MRLVTFKTTQMPAQAGYIVGDSVLGLKVGMLEICACEKPIEVQGPAYRLSDVTLLAPIPRPGKLLCVGVNYAAHATEMKMTAPGNPNIFCKLSSTVIGPGEPIILPKASRRPDYEGEFAFVIGKVGRRIPKHQAMDHVFGYTIFNDVSARDFHMIDSMRWLLGKNYDTFAPMGPWIVTADEITDPHALNLTLEIGGEVLQCSNTREMIFRIPDLIEYLSNVITLEPGDVIATGTPGGVGFARPTPRYLRPGDETVVRISGIGELRNPVVAEP